MDLGLRGKTAVVTGASKGLGKACARALAAEGAKVALCARSKDELEKTAAEIAAETGSEVFTGAFDLLSDEAGKKFREAVERSLGPIDILIANGGGPASGAALEVKDEEIAAAVESTLLFPLRWARAVAPGMRLRGWGRIIVIASTSVKQPIEGLALSNVMRAGVAGFAKTLSAELAADGVLVNVLCPGSTDTQRLRSLIAKQARAKGISVEESERLWREAIPAGRFARPEEFGAVAAFLASEKASYVTGCVIPVDGGLCRGLL